MDIKEIIKYYKPLIKIDGFYVLFLIFYCSISGDQTNIRLYEFLTPITNLSYIIIPIISLILYFMLRSNHLKYLEIKNALLKTGHQNVHSLSPIEFEVFCGYLLENNGWKVSGTKASNDYGADLIASKKKRKIIIQCKRYKSKVSISAVQEIHGAKAYYNIEEAYVVTTLGYTKQAARLAEKTNVKLIVFNDLVNI
jgi:restriction system protein